MAKKSNSFSKNVGGATKFGLGLGGGVGVGIGAILGSTQAALRPFDAITENAASTGEAIVHSALVGGAMGLIGPTIAGGLIGATAGLINHARKNRNLGRQFD
jgi:hypothetical protein